AVGVHAQMDFWHTAQPESFGGILTIVALLVAARPGRARVLAAGLLFGVAVLCKPTLGGAAVVVAAWRAWEAWRAQPRWRQAALPPLLLFAGMAVPLLLCLVWFAATGALASARAVFGGFVPEYTRLGWAGR